MPFHVLHSSDWHLGKRLYHKSREREFCLFLDWLLRQLPGIDLLLIAGDVFDTNSPPIWAQELYYRFLSEASKHCKIVVCAGNHDSALFLEAPRTLLETMGVHIIGNPGEDLQNKVQMYLDGADGRNADVEAISESSPHSGEDEFPPELLPVYDTENNLQALICAVPYLKDSYLRSSSWGESQQDKEQKLQQGIAAYYHVLAAEAERFLEQRGGISALADTPVIATGHLFAGGATGTEGDGVRELYIGSLGHFPASLFPSRFDYVALGHIHQAQKLKASDTEQELRYCGSPLVFSFGELGGKADGPEQGRRAKAILKLEFDGRNKKVGKLEVPQWQQLHRLRGNAAELEQGLIRLGKEASEQDAGPDRAQNIWLELEHSGSIVESSGLRDRLNELVRDSPYPMEILHYRSPSLLALKHRSFPSRFDRLATEGDDSEGDSAESPVQMLNELGPEEVFRHLLEQQSRQDDEGNEGAERQERTPKGEQAGGEQAEEKPETDEQPEEEQRTEVLWSLYRSLLSDIALEKEPIPEEQKDEPRP
ncbi:exonuclease SbcCD subunit D C-terminal domain-containing protein [Candidatus Haliotispira prima]|uniref:Nuclease SbcCD subunit D n=1 Tax=Candidatus Haliotispira prima TaxID=3034016 RepID=A0ABY8MIG4_9SPIO|nr:exonuclease SbcCD subunit D C-terminal domain-containing protein [Candidatus Haliotispira prima]